VTGQPAARLGDMIAHTESAFGFGLGGEIGLGVGLALLTVATGGSDLLVLGAVGGAVALTGGGALMGMNIGSTYGDTAGAITTGALNVLTNGRPAARAMADIAVCDQHSLPQPIATGSTTVFINGMPAARLGDLTVCDARISTASNNVVIGGGTGTFAAVSGEVPQVLVNVATAMAVGGAAVALGGGGAAAFASAGWAGVGVFGLQSAGGIGGGLAGGFLGGKLGGAVDPVHGAAWGQAIGGLGGGVGGGLAGGAAAGGLGLGSAEGSGTSGLTGDAASSSAATPADLAKSWQGTDPYPGVDNWTNTTLPKGTRVYGASPGQGSFYTSADGVSGTDGTAASYYDSLQIAPNTTDPNYPAYRSGITEYEVNTDNLPAATSTASANPGNGGGGATQFFVPDYKTGLTPVQTVPFK
jgi:uncharacterized Zn-binding protein involved in type VI secretion